LCNKDKCSRDNPETTKGKKKCKLKKRFNVGLPTENPPHNHSTIEVPIKGIAENKFVITVAPQKLICPQGKTYPRNAVAINNKKIITPLHQSQFRVPIYEP